jgi:drug/metabolite transporter (DMT)-like permease
MLAVLGGLGAAVIWAVGAAFSSRAARRLGPMQTLAWVMLVGLVVLALVIPWTAGGHLSTAAAGWLLLAGAGNVGGLLILYHAMRIGQLGVVMPIVGTEGGIAALISIVAGQPMTALIGAALTVTVIGVMMTAITWQSPGPSSDPPMPTTSVGAAVLTPHGQHDRRAAAWATLGAAAFGASLYATGRAGNLLPLAWAVLPPRVVGVVALTIPLVLQRKLRWPRDATKLVVVAGLCEIGGFLAYAIGARHNIAIAAVLATLIGAISVGVGRILYRERLTATQLLGVAVIFAGVATVAAVTA